MICSSCSHSVVQKAFDRDRVLRELLYCDLLTKEVVMLVDCSRYLDMKKETVDYEVSEETLKAIYKRYPNLEPKKEVVEPEQTATGFMMLEREELERNGFKKKGWPKGKKRKITETGQRYSKTTKESGVSER